MITVIPARNRRAHAPGWGGVAVAGVLSTKTHLTTGKYALSQALSVGGRDALDRRFSLNLVHNRSRMTMDPRIPTTLGRSMSGIQRPGRHSSHQAPRAVRCLASCMKGELHPTKNRLWGGLGCYERRADDGGPRRKAHTLSPGSCRGANDGYASGRGGVTVRCRVNGSKLCDCRDQCYEDENITLDNCSDQ